ncbi:MAG: hypothetical protein HY897_10915 [Deltaproteobacteria bacterium]|nr:hypothetical protein [Deltaproteobacteria bacterium]
MEGLENKVLVVGAIYVVFLVVYAVFKARYRPRGMRSARTRSVVAEASGYATTAEQQHERRVAWARIATTILVILSFVVLAAVLLLNLRLNK